jgi:hypothetical protein
LGTNDFGRFCGHSKTPEITQKTLRHLLLFNVKGEEAMSERLPVSEFYKVVDHVTVFKNDKWWEAIVVVESFGKQSINMYLWQSRDGAWKRKHKFTIRSLDEWKKVEKTINQLASKVYG